MSSYPIITNTVCLLLDMNNIFVDFFFVWFLSIIEEDLHASFLCDYFGSFLNLAQANKYVVTKCLVWVSGCMSV